MTVVLRIFLAQFLIIEVLSSYVQPQPQPQLQQQYFIKHYVPKEQSPAQHPPKPYPEYQAFYQPNYPPNYPNIQHQRSEPVPPPAAPVMPKPPAEVKVPPKDIEKSTSKCPGSLDAQVLNNLAIALQLLIVNNIINNPPPEVNETPLSKVLGLAYPEQFQMPNSKFLGTSNYGNDISKGLLGIASLGAGSLPSSRSGIALMSPYDAIANSLPLSETLTSSYLAKKDFQSPYSAIMSADSQQDLFSMTDFY